MSAVSNDLFREKFLEGINKFTADFAANSDANDFVMMVVVFLIVVLAFIELSKFMMDGFDVEATTQAVLVVFVTLMLLQGYSKAFDVAYETLDNLGLLILKIGTGNSDGFYLNKWVAKSLTYIYGEDSSLWDMAVGDILFSILWHFVAFFLQCAMFVVASWSTWILSLAKVIGSLFIPLLILPSTRPLFDGWLRFTIGSLLLLVVLRASGVLAAIGIRSQFEAVGIISCNGSSDFANCSVHARDGYAVGLAENGDILTNMVVAIALVVSSVALTTAMAASVASPSKAISKGATKAAGHIIGMFKKG